MDFNDYQQKAKLTATYPTDKWAEYLTLGLCSEAGEVAGKFKKIIRDGTEINRDDIKAEVGDCLWYLAMLATELGIDLDDIAEANIEKLGSRLRRGVIGGSGDNR
jgi:NTP pyrophosphatase (non-canonical NTP hydrolase)